ncbi:MAG: signal peptidase II [Pseudorhodoplanes sp.]
MNRPDSLSWFYGPQSRFGFWIALLVCTIDQASKLWLINVYELAGKGAVAVLPFVDFLLVWNKGISYGLFQQDSETGRWVLFGVKVVAVVLLWVWLARAGSRFTALALGLIIGGALGNGIDRLLHGAVADFVLFHIETARFSFTWYVFNLADVAIVAGVVGLLYESLVGERAAKAP